MPYYPYAPAVSDFYWLLGVDDAGTYKWASFNDPTRPDYVGMLTDVTGLDSADVRDSGDVFVAADGGYSGTNYYGRRPITLQGTIFGHTDIRARNLRMARLRAATNCMMTHDGYLYWQPSWAVPNLMPNSGFETDIAGWVSSGTPFVAAGSTLSRTTAQHVTGSAAMQIVTTSGTSFEGAMVNMGVLGAGTYTFSVWVKGNAGGEGLFLWGGTPSFSSQSHFTATTSWTRQTLQFAADGLSNCYVAITNDGSAGAYTFFVDNVMVNYGTTAPAYFDGDTTGNYWQGTPRLSQSAPFVSTYTSLRRQQPLRFSGAWNKDFQALLVSPWAPIFSSAQAVVTYTATSINGYENQGDFPTFPSIRVFGPTSGTLYVYDNQGRVIFQMVSGFTIASGHYIDVDVQNHYVTQDGTIPENANVNWTASKWTPLVPGPFAVATSSGTCQLTYRHVWA